MKIIDLCLLLLLPSTLLIAHPASANNTEYCGIYNKDGTREILNLTTKIADHAISYMTPQDYYDKCLGVARLSIPPTTIPVNRCSKSYTDNGIYISIYWKGKQYKSDYKVGYTVYQSADIRSVEHCTPVGFAGACSFSTRQETYAKEQCYLVFS